MIDERFPNWDVNIEEGTIYSLKRNRYIGSVSKDGYIQVSPQNNYKHKGVHQYIWMVAKQADIPKGYDVHHIDHNPLNNSIYNLELIDTTIHRSEHKIGKQHSEETKRKISEAQINNPSKSKQVGQYTLEGELVKIWCSMREAERNGFNKGAVSVCCNGKLKKHKGFIWKYYNEEKDVA